VQPGTGLSSSFQGLDFDHGVQPTEGVGDEARSHRIILPFSVNDGQGFRPARTSIKECAGWPRREGEGLLLVGDRQMTLTE